MRSALLILGLALLIPFQNCSAPKIPNSFDASSSSNASIDQSYPPATPTNLVLHAVSDQQINLQWSDNSSNEAGFRIERASASSGPFTSGMGTYTAINTVPPNTTSYIDRGLIAQTTYYYRVVAVNAAGASLNSNEESASTTAQPSTVPLAPSNLIATAATSTIVNLSWNDNSSNESGFKIERSVNAGASFTLIAITSADQNSYSDPNLTPQTSYTYRVRATNLVGDSVNTANALATTAAAVNTSSFTYINANILQTNCVACHGAGLASGGVNLASYNSVLGVVVKNNSANSRLYQVISDNSMPPGAPLSANQKQYIQMWIDNGALNN